MDIHIAVAELPETVEAVAERRPSNLYIVVAARLGKIATATAVADVVMTALNNGPTP